MKKLLVVLVFLFAVASVMAVQQTNVSYFYSVTCTYCAAVAESGILENVSGMENVSVEKFEISLSQSSRDKFSEFADGFGIAPKDRGIPFVVIEREGRYSYLMGDVPIIEHLKNSIIDFQGVSLSSGVDKPFIGKLTLWVVIAAALIDSINPCAFGVLLFLMAVLLSMGSSKRALRAGVLYTIVIFFVYLLAGFGIMKLISSFSLLDNVRLIVGIIVLIGALIEFKDFFWEGKGVSLRIPVSTKPLLEKFIRRGTLPAIFVLGMLVALVELPCTGGIYLAILSLISNSGTKGTLYLVIYNLIFVLPLIVISYAIYHGAKVESLNRWVQKNKRYMRLAAAIIMVLLGLSLLGIV